MTKLEKLQLKSLIKDRDHWHKVRMGRKLDDGILSSACCKEFYENKCNNCPIAVKTRFPQCMNTPCYDLKFEICYSDEYCNIAHRMCEMLDYIILKWIKI